MSDYGVNITRDYCVNVMRYLVFESHTPAVYIYRRYELTAYSNLSTFLFSTFHIVDKHPRLSLLFATSSPLSPVYSYGGGSAPNDGHLCLLYTSLLVIHTPVHLYSPRLRRRFRRSILTALMRPPPHYILSRNGPYNYY